MSALEQLYQQIILDHAKEKHGRGLRDAGAGQQVGESRQYNPLCGDEVTLRVALAYPDGAASPNGTASPEGAASPNGGSPTVADVSWQGEGCSISQASTSVLYDLLAGQSLAEATRIVDAFRAMIRSRGQDEPDEDLLGDATAFVGVGRHSNRVKCAMLGWTAFEAAVLAARASHQPTQPPEEP